MPAQKVAVLLPLIFHSSEPRTCRLEQKTNSEVEQEQLALDQQQNPSVIVKLADLENVAITADFGHQFRNSKRIY